MAARMCNADRLAQRVTVFVSEFIRNTYGFLTPTHVEQLRSFRNGVEDNFPACPLLTPNNAPWKDRNSFARSDVSESESDEDCPPPAKKTRKLSDSSPENEQRSVYKNPPPQKHLTLSTRLPKSDLTRNGQGVL